MARPEAAFFWATHTGAELDLLLISRMRKLIRSRWGNAARLAVY
jgi:hypothetical protein